MYDHFCSENFVRIPNCRVNRWPISLSNTEAQRGPITQPYVYNFSLHSQSQLEGTTVASRLADMLAVVIETYGLQNLVVVSHRLWDATLIFKLLGGYTMGVWRTNIYVGLLSPFGCEHVAYMSIHDFGVFDLRYYYRSDIDIFPTGFVSDVSIFRYRYHFLA
jgi:hypothetical protein